MQNYKLVLIIISIAYGGHKQIFSQQSPVSEVKSDSTILHLADPTVFHHAKRYYLYGTVEGNTGKGFLTYTSADLKNWKLSDKNDGYALRKGGAFGRSGFWAPQIFSYRDKFYMAYVANEQIAIAESISPEGPFMQKIKDSLRTSVKQIDPFVFIDDDGKKYLYHVRLSNGNRIFAAEMNDDLSSIRSETLHECIAAAEDWENTTKAPWPVAEGPSVIKHKGSYYLFYTANDFRNPDYAVGYATSSSPLGPWKKYEGNPILAKAMIGVNGTGHGDFFNNGKELFYVFHTHNSNSNVSPRNTGLIKAKFIKGKKNEIEKLVMEPKSFYFLRN